MNLAKIFLAVSTLAALLGIAACANNEQEQPHARALAPEVSTHAGDWRIPATTESTPSELICMLLKAGADATQLGSNLGLQLVASNSQGLALYRGDIDLDNFSNEAVSHAERNIKVTLGAPADVTMGYHESGEFDLKTLQGQGALKVLRVAEVWQQQEGGGIRVAVLDTGVDPTHSILADNLELLSTGPLSSIDVADFVDNDEDGMTDEAYGHGTHVSGIILSVAPKATVIPIRVLNEEGEGYLYDIATGLLMASELNAHIVNMSLVLSNYSPMVATILDGLAGQNIVVLAAAGNELPDVAYPAYDPHALSVTATNSKGTAAPFSWSTGAESATPGVAILSAFPGDQTAVASGTSMSTALASGLVALLSGGPFEAEPRLALDLLLTHAVEVDRSLALVHGGFAPVRVAKELRLMHTPEPAPEVPGDIGVR